MTITARKTRTELKAAATLLDSIADRVASGVGTTLDAIAAGERPGSDKPRAEDAGVRGINWISDPTQAAALSRIGALEYHLPVEDYIETLKVTLTLLVNWANEYAPVVVDHPRCSGGRTVEEWSRPDCQNFVAYTIRDNGTFSYRGDGLCDRCRSAKRRHDTDTAA